MHPVNFRLLGTNLGIPQYSSALRSSSEAPKSASETRQSLRPIACSLLGVSRRSVGDLRIFFAAGRGRLAGPVPHTSVYFWPPGGGAHEISLPPPQTGVPT